MASPIIARQQNVDPVLTGLVVGTPRPFEMPSKRIAKTITVPNVKFQYRTHGREHLQVRSDVKRAASAKIRTARFETGQLEDKIERYTFGYESDIAEMQNAIDLDVAGINAFLARAVVENVIEKEFADLITAAATYDASHVVTLGAGSEWDDATNGDSKASILAVAGAISEDTQIPISSLSVYLPHAAYNAALMDPVMNGILNLTQIDAATTDILRRYWGVKEVWSASSSYVADHGTDLLSMYGDTAVVYYDSGPAPFDGFYGNYTFAVDFSFNEGVALEAYYDPSITTWVFPWERWNKYKVISNVVGGIVLNTSSAV